MAEPVALAALALDAGLGWPARLHAVTGHPVGAFARLIATCERRWNRPGLGDFARRVLGTVTVALLIAVRRSGRWRWSTRSAGRRGRWPGRCSRWPPGPRWRSAASTIMCAR
jgi:cobalamin biosynthesis protein CobD/CbiB